LSLAGLLVVTLSLTPDTAASATLLIRFATLWFGVLLGLLVWLFSKDLLFPAASYKLQAPSRNQP
jgi:uncharacterized membrane protein YbhN (UPF0104 family)